MEPLSTLWPVSDVASKLISIYEGPEVFLRDYSAATEVHQHIFAAYWFQAEFLNGGLTQFFGNSTGVLAPEAVEAYKAMNLPLLAAKLQESIDLFGYPYPRERELREAKLEAFAENNDPEIEPFDTLDKEITQLIHEEAGGLESSALAYIKRLEP